jgi:hypothetical protein
VEEWSGQSTALSWLSQGLAELKEQGSIDDAFLRNLQDSDGALDAPAPVRMEKKDESCGPTDVERQPAKFNANAASFVPGGLGTYPSTDHSHARSDTILSRMLLTNLEL